MQEGSLLLVCLKPQFTYLLFKRVPETWHSFARNEGDETWLVLNVCSYSHTFHAFYSLDRSRISAFVVLVICAVLYETTLQTDRPTRTDFVQIKPVVPLAVPPHATPHNFPQK